MNYQEALDNIYRNSNADMEDLLVLQELIDIATTPICEDCEPTDLNMAKIKLRLMADECNRQTKLLEKALDIACGNTDKRYIAVIGRGNNKNKALKELCLEAAERELKESENNNV